MRVLVLGATGYIGASVLAALRTAGHETIALSRARRRDRGPVALGARILRGDLREPEAWAPAVRAVDGVVQVAATFESDMGAVERAVLRALAAQAGDRSVPLRFVYTGGVWLYGETGDRLAREEDALDPPPGFAWMADNWDWLRLSPAFAPVLVHPAIVYDRDGGGVGDMIGTARDLGRVEILGDPAIRWPLVHRDDIGAAYRLVLEGAPPGSVFNIAAEEGVSVGALAGAIGERFSLTEPPAVIHRSRALSERGEEAFGPMLDQRISGDRLRQAFGWRPRYPDAVSVLAGSGNAD